MTKMTKKQERDEAVLKHGLKLQRIFPATAGVLGPVQLYDALRHIENAAHRNAERSCNDERYTTAMVERDDARLLDRLDALLKFKADGIPVFLNGDPRGYALKIESGYVREYKLDIQTDWGGYGILAPEFS